MLFADSIGELIDEARNIRIRFLSQRGDYLFRRQRHGERRGQAHDLDAEPRSTVSILSQRSRVKRFTSRTGRAVPMRMASIRLSIR